MFRMGDDITAIIDMVVNKAINATWKDFLLDGPDSGGQQTVAGQQVGA